ncbi:DUF1444 domain-containing protein [bacterium LRH843]|nr:DUF1444 domain-containing protein [bacterium LRH843]
MNIQQFRKEIEQKLDRDGWSISYDHKESTLRIVDNELKKGVTLALKPLLAKWERKEYTSVDEAIRYVEVGLHSMKQKLQLAGNEKNIFPVIRSTSFPEETNDGKPLLMDEHTAETRIYYVIDLGESYSLIQESLLLDSPYTKEKIREIAMFNVRSLSQPLKEDVVAGNRFYFLRANDGYDASRVLDQSLLDRMEKQAAGQLAVAIPHQDVLIFADIVNERGYDVLAQLALRFFGEGRVPVTALPFMYESGELEPIFILAQRKQK